MARCEEFPLNRQPAHFGKDLMLRHSEQRQKVNLVRQEEAYDCSVIDPVKENEKEFKSCCGQESRRNSPKISVFLSDHHIA